MKPVKSSRNWKFRIQDILKAINKIETFVNEASLEQFKKDDMMVDAVMMNIAIIGEASKYLPSTLQATFHDIPWKKINGMRNLLIHEYFGVNTDIIWHTVKGQLPELKQRMEEILKTLEE